MHSKHSFEIDFCMLNNEARFLNYHGLKKSQDGMIVIPSSLECLLAEDAWIEEFQSLHMIPYTSGNIEHIMQIYIQAVYFEHWYTSMADTFTIRSIFYPLEGSENVFWNEPKFVRLNSVSPKYKKPVYSLDEAKSIIAASPRCNDAITVAKHYGFESFIVIRDWKDFSHGNEYRSFVYNDRLTAITNHDNHNRQSLTEADLIKRVQNLLDLAKYTLPYTTVCMDVFIHNTDEKKDCVIEFSAYGAATDTGSGSFHWLTDMWALSDASEVTVRIDYALS